MNSTGNTILITGGGSGIGRGLAEAFAKAGNQVVISGRRKAVLDEVTAANAGIKSLTLDIEDPASIATFATQIAEQFPTLNVVIHNAGIMRMEKLNVANADVADAEAIIRTNLLGPIRLNAALLPLLQKQPQSTVMTVSSGLAFVPMAMTPTYSATKAGLHAYTQSLRYQLRGTSTQVVELIPPYVATDLMGGAADPRAMPLPDFIAEVMKIIQSQPDVTEILVERVKPLRFAAATGKFDAIFNGMNDAMSGPH